MEKYKDLYKWMILPMIIMQFGIFKDYWGDFTDNAWSVHIHYWTGTIWYLYLIIQPYYATHGQLEKHRTNGIIGMFIAGGVCLTALSMIHRDLVVVQRALDAPEKFGPFGTWFFYGVMCVETLMILGFGYAVIQSIRKRKNMEDHAWWLVSTVFIIMMPALGRGIQGVYIAINRSDWPNIDILSPIYLCQLLIILMILLSAWKYKKLKHPATFLAIAINIVSCLIWPLGNSQMIQTLLNTVVKG